jgi:FkbM family methyltransferase
MSNLLNLQHSADSTTSRAWYTVPVRRLFFKIMAPFLVYLADRTSALEAQQAGLMAAQAQTIPRIDRVEALATSDHSITAALGEQVAQLTGTCDKVRQQSLLLDGLRKEQLAVGARLGDFEDTLGQLEDRVALLGDGIAHFAQRMTDADERLRLVRVLEDARDTSHAELADRVSQLAQRMTAADERLRMGIATLPRETTLAVAGTSLVLHDGPYGRFLLRQPDLISDCITRGGFWDEYLKAIIEQTGRPDRCAIDAGAYLGFHSTYMSRYFGTVYSFEPQLEMFRMMSANLLLNNCRNVVATNGALYDVEGHMRIARRDLQEIPVPGELAQPAYDVIGNAAALVFEAVNEPDDRSVPCTTIDSLGLTTLGLLKVDTQGSDLHVLKGAGETIARCRPTIVTEFERELARAHQDTYDDYLAFFADINYEVRTLENRADKQIDLLGVPR